MIHCDPLHDHSLTLYYHGKMSWGGCGLRLFKVASDAPIHHTFQSTKPIQYPVAVLLITADLKNTAFLAPRLF